MKGSDSKFYKLNFLKRLQTFTITYLHEHFLILGDIYVHIYIFTMIYIYLKNLM
jgi:hypothetical protein